MKTLKWCSQKFGKEFIIIEPSFGQCQMPSFHFTKIRVFMPLERSINIIKKVKLEKNPNQNTSYFLRYFKDNYISIGVYDIHQHSIL